MPTFSNHPLDQSAVTDIKSSLHQQKDNDSLKAHKIINIFINKLFLKKKYI